MSIINAILEDKEYTEAQTLADLIETLSKTTGDVKPVDTTNTLELNPYQSDFLTSPDRGFDEVLYSGAVGCLSGDCRIWTANGLERMDDLYRRGKPFLVWSMGKSGIPSLEWSTAPFIRGREPLMKVDLEGGRSFRCAGKHRVQLASHAWTSLHEVSPGDQLRSIGDICPSEFQQGALRSTGTAEGSSGHCSTGCHPGDGLPLHPSTDDPGSSPLPIGAQDASKSAHAYQRSREPERTGILSGIWALLRSMLGLAYQSSSSEVPPVQPLLGQTGDGCAVYTVSHRDQRKAQRESPLDNEALANVPGLAGPGELEHLVGSSNVTCTTSLGIVGWSIPTNCPSVYYDLTVESTSNYIGEWGIVHHNCGKSLLLCIALLRYVSKPNTPVLLCRYNLSDLKKSTLKTLLEPETQRDGSIREPLLPVQAIKSYNKSESIIYLHNGSQIILCGVSDVEKIRSINCAAAFGEEVSEFSEEMWTAVQQRCRVPCALPNTFMAATNPKHKGHFLYRRFFEDEVPSRRVITVSAYSNKYLSAAYIRQLESLPEPERSKMLCGQWVDTASAVFPTFSRTHVRDCSKMPEEAFSSFLVSQDYGGGAGFCGAVLLGVGKDGLIYCLDELYKQKQTHSNMLDWMEPYRRQSNSTVVYDSANAALRLDMENAEWKCIPCIKDIEGSIGIVNDRFNSNSLVIHEKCTNLISHLENAARDPRTGIISKLKAWDVIDAYRYGICALTTSMKEELVEQPGMLYYIP